MTSLDDLPLDTGRDDSPQVAPSAPSSPGPRLVPIVIAVLAAGGGAAWWWSSTRAPSAAPGASAGASAPATAAATVEDASLRPALPPLGQMDPMVRELLTGLSRHPTLLAWLATDDLVASLATAIDRLSQGQSPARDVAVLRPIQGFATTRRDRVTVVDPTSHARYTPLVQAVTSVDPDRAADVFLTLRPRLDEAYRAQGHPEGAFDAAADRAIQVLTSTPDVPPDAALVPGVGGLAYADPALERLPPAQKHLLRMGPEHVRVVREAARRFGAALAARRSTATR